MDCIKDRVTEAISTLKSTKNRNRNISSIGPGDTFLYEDNCMCCNRLIYSDKKISVSLQDRCCNHSIKSLSTHYNSLNTITWR